MVKAWVARAVGAGNAAAGGRGVGGAGATGGQRKFGLVRVGQTVDAAVAAGGVGLAWGTRYGARGRSTFVAPAVGWVRGVLSSNGIYFVVGENAVKDADVRDEKGRKACLVLIEVDFVGDDGLARIRFC